ncbi:MAG: rod shape-determining protein MreC [Proteobacteria bacterium]|nr:rod shape-determining protein MreC [Pseudomonadota bacterium]
MLVFALISIALMVLDHRSSYVQNAHAKLSAVVVPVQVLVDEPIKLIHWLTTTFKLQRKLLDDNARLNAQQLFLESKMQKLLALEKENAQLRQLLQSTPQATGKVIVAQLLAVAMNPATQQVIIDRGSADQLYLGQPVLDAYGVLGQVISIGPLTSRVLLVTDIQSAVPVQNYRTGARAIAIGSGSSGQLRLINLPDNSDIQEGDLYVASGMGLRFPVGYPVGVVAKSALESGEKFATIFLIPAAHLTKSEQVLLAWPEKASYDQAVQEQLREAAMEKKP